MIDLDKKLTGNYKYYIYGISNFGKYCKKFITENYGEEHFLGFVETLPEVGIAEGKNVLAVSDLDLKCGEKVIIASFANEQMMRINLTQAGVDQNNIIYLKEFHPYFRTMQEVPCGIRKVCIYPGGWKENEKLCEKVRWFMPERIDLLEEWDMDKADAILVYKVSAISDLLEDYKDKIHNIDPEFFYYVETGNWDLLYYQSFSEEEQRKFREHSRKIYRNMKQELEQKNIRKGNVFCSGPSISEYLNDFKKYKGIDKEFNVICNSMVKDKEMLNVIKPSLLAFTDLNYYLSPTAYCRQFLADVVDGWHKYHFYIAVYEREVPLLLRHYPIFEGYVMGIANNAGAICFPGEEGLSVKRAGNILTETMLPVASSLCDEVGIFGSTGRVEGETFYWKHNDRTQYKELMQSIFDTYPSLFRDMGYADYYERHCQNVQNLLAYGEAKGKKYYNFTTSFIPALKERSVQYE